MTDKEIIQYQATLMQAAFIELMHGHGASAAMQWIRNYLQQTGMLPNGTDAQKWFDDNAALKELSNDTNSNIKTDRAGRIS